MLKEMRAVSARSSNKLMGWCWKQMFLMLSCVPCKNETKTPTTSKLQVVDEWTGNVWPLVNMPWMDRKWVKLWRFIPSVRFICFLHVRDPDGGGWIVKWKKLLSTSKKTTFFSDTTKHPRYPWVDFNCCLNFEMFFSISLRKLTNKTQKIYSSTLCLLSKSRGWCNFRRIPPQVQTTRGPRWVAIKEDSLSYWKIDLKPP